MITVLIADDHGVLRLGLKRMLEQSGGVSVLGEAETGEQACHYYDQYLPDILLLDLSMPGMGGLAAIARIRAKHPRARIIVFSMHETASLASQALKSGALGYVSKCGGNGEILDAIQDVYAGKSYISQVLSTQIAMQALQGAGNPLQTLSPREYEILRLYAEGYSMVEIGKLLCISNKTVSNKFTIIKQKLEVETALDLLRLALKYQITELPQ